MLPTIIGLLRSNAVSLPADLELGWAGIVRQTAVNTCGPAVIATLLLWRGETVSDSEIADHADVGSGGVTLAEFERLAADVHLSGSWLKSSALADVLLASLPAVLHLEDESGHFAILTRKLGPFLELADPARGLVLVPESVLQHRWSGLFFALEGNTRNRQ